jgi:hypothetical protein
MPSNEIPQRLSVRIAATNPNHHLWNNNGFWWCHYTLYFVGGSRRRVRHSLRTSDLEKARIRRDRVLSALMNCGKHSQAA